MSRTPLLTTPYLVIEHDARNFLYLNWKGYVSVPQVKEGCEHILRITRQMKCSMFINDNRELSGTWTQAIPWLAEDFLPRFLRGGLQKIAFIYSPDRSARYSVDRLLEMNDQYFAQTFEDYDSAEKWLLTEQIASIPAETAALPGRTLTLRTQEHHTVIEIHDIYYLSSRRGSTLIHTRNGTFDSKTTLKELQHDLPAPQFQRVHRSHIINIREVGQIKYNAGGSYHVFLRELPKIRIPVSRSYAAVLKRRLGIRSQS